MVFGVHRYSDNERAGELNERGSYRRGKEPIKYESVVEVLKNRITGLVPKVELYFDYPSYRFYRTPEELWYRYKWDKGNKNPLGWDKKLKKAFGNVDLNDHKLPRELNPTPIDD